MSDHLSPGEFFEFIDQGGGSGPVGWHLLACPECLFELDFLLAEAGLCYRGFVFQGAQAIPSEVPFKEWLRLASLELGLRFNSDGHHFVPATIEKLSPVGCPKRSATPVRRCFRRVLLVIGTPSLAKKALKREPKSTGPNSTVSHCTNTS